MVLQQQEEAESPWQQSTCKQRLQHSVLVLAAADHDQQHQAMWPHWTMCCWLQSRRRECCDPGSRVSQTGPQRRGLQSCWRDHDPPLAAAAAVVALKTASTTCLRFWSRSSSQARRHQRSSRTGLEPRWSSRWWHRAFHSDLQRWIRRAPHSSWEEFATHLFPSRKLLPSQEPISCCRVRRRRKRTDRSTLHKRRRILCSACLLLDATTVTRNGRRRPIAESPTLPDPILPAPPASRSRRPVCRREEDRVDVAECEEDAAPMFSLADSTHWRPRLAAAAN